MKLLKGFNDASSANLIKVHVCGHYYGFSRTIINEYLGRGRLINTDWLPSMKTIVHEIT